MEAVWPGVIVTDDSITQCVAEIRRVLGEEGSQLLRTLPKRGYMLAAKVEHGAALPLQPSVSAGHTDVVPPGSVSQPITQPPSLRRRWITVTLGVAAVAVLGGIGWWALPSRPPQLASPAVPQATIAEVAAQQPRRSIVVLPFTTLGGGQDQDYLADGITDELTVALGRLALIQVIGHSTASAYRSQTVDVRQVGRELGVGYVVEGSLRRIGDQLRVNARLLDAGSGAQLWAESLDEPLADLAVLTRVVTLRIARALDDGLYIAAAARSRTERPQTPDVVDLVLQARALQKAPRTAEIMGEIRRLYERALTLDEGSADAQAGLALTLVDTVSFGWSQDRDADLREAEAHASRALALDPRQNGAHFAKGMLLSRRFRFAEAEAEFDRIIVDSPSNVAAIAFRGRMKLYTDQPAAALVDFQDAVRISPRDWNLETFYSLLSVACHMLGRDDEALGYRLRARAVNPQQPDHLFLLAAALQLVGRTTEAHAVLEEYRRLRPNSTIAGWRRAALRQSPYPLYVATRERQLAATRAVGGMPEE
jgi:TolB-like protein/Flp pilus assembly protein TadD